MKLASNSLDQRRLKLLGPAFVMFEAVMHLYLVIYLIAEGANVPVIGFTLFELVMFVYLLAEARIMKANG